jgi:hypothetical protein
MRWLGHVAHMGDRRRTYRDLVERPLKRPKHRWQNNIKMNIQETGWEGKDSIDVVRDRNK